MELEIPKNKYCFGTSYEQMNPGWYISDSEGHIVASNDVDPTEEQLNDILQDAVLSDIYVLIVRDKECLSTSTK